MKNSFGTSDAKQGVNTRMIERRVTASSLGSHDMLDHVYVYGGYLEDEAQSQLFANRIEEEAVVRVSLEGAGPSQFAVVEPVQTDFIDHGVVKRSIQTIGHLVQGIPLQPHHLIAILASPKNISCAGGARGQLVAIWIDDQTVHRYRPNFLAQPQLK